MKLTTIKQVGTKMQKDIENVQKLGQKLEESLEKFNQALAVLEGNNEEVAPNVQKRKPGRPAKSNKETVAKLTVKRGPGRPKKNTTEEVVSETPKKKPGRPKKNQTETATTTTAKRKPGRPKKNEVVAKSTNKSVKGSKNADLVAEINRVKDDIDTYNQWAEVNDSERIMAVIENATYRGEVVGFYSKGGSGRFGVTTRVYLNPDSNLVPEELKHHITTAAVNRIRYVDTEAEGLDYIEKQKEKLKNDYFNEIMPKVLKDHGKPGSDYAFHCDKTVRRNFNQLKSLYDKEYKTEIEKETVMA